MVAYGTNGIRMVSELRVEAFLPYRLARIAEAVSRDFAAVYRGRHGMTRPEWRTLAILGERGTLTATEIGVISAMHKTKVSRAVAALEKRKWLMRRTDENDRRVERLTLTRSGVRVYGELAPLAVDYDRRLAVRLGADAEVLSALLGRVEDALGIQPTASCSTLAERAPDRQ